jgi:hypothetical protein
LPFASLQRVVAAGAGLGAGGGVTAAGGHLINLPCASLQGAASDGVAKNMATPAASNILRYMVHPLMAVSRPGAMLFPDARASNDKSVINSMAPAPRPEDGALIDLRS